MNATTSLAQCECVDGFHGTHCNNPPDVCKGFCENDGSCFVAPGENGLMEPKCTCVNGYWGHHCNNNFCDNYDCNNKGPCNIKTEMTASGTEIYNPHCKCGDGFHGKHCDAFDDGVCQDFLCDNGGVCESKLIHNKDDSSFFKAECACAEGYHGKHCKSMTAVCDLACEHGSQCLVDKRKNEPYCDCQGLDWDGDLCSTPIVACGPSIYCHNGGTCESPTDSNANPDDGYWCDCETASFLERKWGGPHCVDMIEEDSSGHSDGAIAGITIASIAGAAIVTFLLAKYVRYLRSKSLPDDLIMKSYEDRKIRDHNTSIHIEVLSDDKEMI